MWSPHSSPTPWPAMTMCAAIRSRHTACTWERTRLATRYASAESPPGGSSSLQRAGSPLRAKVVAHAVVLPGIVREIDRIPAIAVHAIHLAIPISIGIEQNIFIIHGPARVQIVRGL